MFDEMFSVDELEAQLGCARREETLGGLLRTGQPADLPAAELVPGHALAWTCGCRAVVGDSGPEGPFYTLEACNEHRELKSGPRWPCVVLAELAGLGGQGPEFARSPSADACRRMLTLAIEMGPANIPVVFSRSFDELGGLTLNDLLLSGHIDRAADALEIILDRHPGLRIVRILSDG